MGETHFPELRGTTLPRRLNNGHASRAQSVCSGKNQNHSQADDSDIFGYVLASNYHLALITVKTTSYPLRNISKVKSAVSEPALPHGQMPCSIQRKVHYRAIKA